MKLFTNKICPFAQRAHITALEKNVNVELVTISLAEEAPDWYKAINPRETVPALSTADGKVVIESLYVARYLDENFEPRNALMTNDPATRLVINNFIDSLGPFIGSCYSFLFGDDAEAGKAAEEVARNVEKVEARLAALSAGPFVLGDRFTMADVALVPFIDRFRYTLRRYRGFALLDRAPRMAALVRAAFLRPSVWSTAMSAQGYVEAYGHGMSGRPPIQPLQWTITAEANSTAAKAISTLLTWIRAEAPLASAVRLVTVPKLDGVTLESPSTPKTDGNALMTVLEWIAEEFGALQPADAFERSTGRTFANIADYLSTEAAADAQMTQLIRGGAAQGPFLFGATPTIYDAAVLPLIDQAVKDAKAGTLVGPTLRALLDAATKNADVKAIYAA